MSSVEAGGVTVGAYDETPTGDADMERWCEVARSTLVAEGVAWGQLDLIFVDEESMTELNLEHMGQAGPTDVLAFPLDGPDAVDTGASFDGSVPPPHLGDVVVSPEVARRQATSHSGSIESELTLLVVHGVLHVLGHDHAEDDERLVMQARERHHLGRYGFAHPVPA